MNNINTIAQQISNTTTIPKEYVRLTILTILAVLIVNILKGIMVKVYTKIDENSRKRYMYNKKMGIFATILNIILIVLIWENHIKGMITLISFVSAAITFAIRDIICNFFAGMYIKFAKPFQLEDRIEINNLKGDIVNINTLSFEILEIGDRVNGEQSTGRIAHVPNSQIFQYALKNYTKAFKYVWAELLVRIDLKDDLEKTKQILHDIVMKNDVIKEIPDKMEDQIDDASLEYRIYYNNLKPIIYTAVVKGHIELYIRYLVHPKKARGTEDSIWTDIIEANKRGDIKLYENDD